MYDLTLIAVMAVVGIALKPVVSTLAHIVSAPLLIPGGALASGLYMMWVVLAFAVTGKFGSATLAGFVQAILVIVTGIPGSHGILSLLTYTAPGIVIDLLMAALLLPGGRAFDRLASFFAGIAASLTGIFFVNVIFMRLPAPALALTFLAAAISGGVGGLIAWELFRVVKKHKLTRRR